MNVTFRKPPLRPCRAASFAAEAMLCKKEQRAHGGAMDSFQPTSQVRVARALQSSRAGLVAESSPRHACAHPGMKGIKYTDCGAKLALSFSTRCIVSAVSPVELGIIPVAERGCQPTSGTWTTPAHGFPASKASAHAACAASLEPNVEQPFRAPTLTQPARNEF